MKHFIIFTLSLGLVFSWNMVKAQETDRATRVPSVFSEKMERMRDKTETPSITSREERRSMITPERMLKGEGHKKDSKTNGIGDAIKNFVKEHENAVQQFTQERKYIFGKLKEEKKQSFEDIKKERKNEMEALKESYTRGTTSTESMRSFIKNNPGVIQAFREKEKELRTKFEQRREEVKRVMEKKKEEVKRLLEEKKQEFEKNLLKIKDEKKAEIAKRIFEQFNQIKERNLEHFRTVFTNLDSILQKIKTRAEKASAYGVDTHSVSELVTSAGGSIRSGRTLIESLAGKVYSATISGEGALKTDLQKTRDELRNDLRNIQKSLKSAHDAVRKAAESLSNIPNVNEFEVESKTAN